MGNTEARVERGVYEPGVVHPMAMARTPAAVTANQLPAIRQRRGLTAEQLGKRLQDVGSHLTGNMVAKIESGQRGVSLDEIFHLAAALDVAPVHLVAPLDDEEGVTVTGGAAGITVKAPIFRSWIRGERELPGRDAKPYQTEIPESEWQQRNKRLHQAERAVHQAERRLRVLRLKSRQLSADLAEVEGTTFTSAGQVSNSMNPQYRRLSAKLDLCYDELAEAAVELEDAQGYLDHVKSEEGDLGRAEGRADLFRAAADDVREGKPLSPAMTAAAEMLKPIVAKADAGEDDGGLATALRREPNRLAALRDFLGAVEAAPSGEGYLSDGVSRLVQEHRQRKTESE